MTSHGLVFSDGRRATPLGPLTLFQIHELEQLGVWRYKDGNFTLVSHKLEKSGKSPVWIPIVFFNLEFYLKKLKSFEKAIKVLRTAPQVYLPDIEGYDSYNQLFNSLTN